MDTIAWESVARWVTGLVMLWATARWVYLLVARPDYVLGDREDDAPGFFPRLRRQVSSKRARARVSASGTHWGPRRRPARQRRVDEGPIEAADTVPMRITSLPPDE